MYLQVNKTTNIDEILYTNHIERKEAIREKEKDILSKINTFTVDLFASRSFGSNKNVPSMYYKTKLAYTTLLFSIYTAKMGFALFGTKQKEI